MEKIQIKPLIKALTFFFTLFILVSCVKNVDFSKNEKTENSIDIYEQESFFKITDIPIPITSQIDMEKTVVVGEGEEWMGRLSLVHKENIEDIYSFFVNEMPKYGYEEKNSVESNKSSLIFQNNKKTIFIKISKHKLGNSYIEITATPIN